MLNKEYLFSLPLKIENIHYLQECINFKIKVKDKLYNFIGLYDLCNQFQDHFESLINNFGLNHDSYNPFLTVVLGDFDAKINSLVLQ